MMKLTFYLLLITLIFLGNFSEVSKHSFQAPFLFGVSSNIPHWDYGGAAIATEHFLRLTPIVKSRVGYIWNLEPVEMSSWEVIIKLNVHNAEGVGADGIGFWYSKEIKKDGSLFGQDENFEGIGIIFDSYDNNADGEEPSIKIVKGTGQKITWDYGNDLKSNALGLCSYNFRNLPSNHIFSIKITYEKEVLSIYYDPIGNGDFIYCTKSEKIKLPHGYHFGLTAATGGLADYHDIYSFKTRNLDSTAQPESAREHGWWDPYEFYRTAMLEKEKELKDRQHQQEQPDWIKKFEEEKKTITRRKIKI